MSPLPSTSRFQFYIALLDDYSHFVWKFPLRHKSDALPVFRNFATFIHTHFTLPILTLQAANGREFDNHVARAFLSGHGMLLCMSCPYTSPQNGRAEPSLHTLKDIVRTLLIHANIPFEFWVEALNAATFLLNRRPSRPRHGHTPFYLLYGEHPDYSSLRVFGCLCLPNLSATSPHKLAPRSSTCVFLGYSQDHKGYRCLNRTTNCVIISRHVVFDEHQFPYRDTSLSLVFRFTLVDFFGKGGYTPVLCI